MPATSQNKEKFEDYDGFVEKFKPKKKPPTTATHRRRSMTLLQTGRRGSTGLTVWTSSARSIRAVII